MSNAVLLQGDCLEVLKELPDDSVDSLVCDPPAGIAFMGKAWDEDKGGSKQWISWLSGVMVEAKRVMKPGAHGLIWALPRTSHWTATALEDAGFEIRDVVTHLFGSGFPKSHNIEKATGDERFKGFGTALKPASEHWILVRKPCSEKTVAANVLLHGTGGINIDASRIDPSPGDVIGDGLGRKNGQIYSDYNEYKKGDGFKVLSGGRFPANLIFSHNEDCVEVGTKKVKGTGNWTGKQDGSAMWHRVPGPGYECKDNNPEAEDGTETVSAWECSEGCPVAELDRQSGECKSAGNYKNVLTAKTGGNGMFAGGEVQNKYANESGGASRFFYCAKPSKREKNAGCDLDSKKAVGARPNSGDPTGKFPDHDQRERVGNFHPTVKSTKLMSYLITMVTPPDGVVLDPFMGSGTTGVAAINSGFKFIGIERESEYMAICEARIAHAETLTEKGEMNADVNDNQDEESA